MRIYRTGDDHPNDLPDFAATGSCAELKSDQRIRDMSDGWRDTPGFAQFKSLALGICYQIANRLLQPST